MRNKIVEIFSIIQILYHKVSSYIDFNQIKKCWRY